MTRDARLHGQVLDLRPNLLTRQDFRVLCMRLVNVLKNGRKGPFVTRVIVLPTRLLEILSVLVDRIICQVHVKVV